MAAITLDVIAAIRLGYNQMIKSFTSKDTELLFNDHLVKRFRSIERQARRKLYYLHRARTLQDLLVPPGNRLEGLSGRREGEYSIRINDQWRVCFKWLDGDAYNVEIVDYH
jgi:proteic killer suppression protein